MTTTSESALLLDYAVMNVEAIEQEDGLLQVMLDGKPLTCVVCGNQHYQEDRFLLNPAVASCWDLRGRTIEPPASSALGAVTFSGSSSTR